MQIDRSEGQVSSEQKTPEQAAEEYVDNLESQQPGCFNQSYGEGDESGAEAVS